jgi:hypothetical protein
MSGMDDVKRSFADWCSVAAERTAEAAKVTSRRYDKFAIGRDIERRQAELGALIYQGLTTGRTDVLADPRVAELVAAVGDLERERDLKEEEIAGIRQEYAERRHPDGSGTTTGAGTVPAASGSGPAAPPPSGADCGDRRPDLSD